MSNTIRIKRRVSGANGAPSTLQNAEPAFNEVEEVLYYGKGTGGAGGTATAAIPIGGSGAFVDKTNNQTIGGVKTFSSSPVAPTPTSTDNSTKVATTEYVKAVVDQAVTGAVKYKGTLDASLGAYPASPSQGDYYVISVAGTIEGHYYSVGDWAAFDGTDWDYVDNSNKVSSVNGYVGAVVLTKGDLSLGNVDNTSDANKPVSTAQAASIATKLSIGNNLSDLNSASAARTNLGLGTMAVQNASSVAITGGTIDGINLDGGTF